MTIKFEPIKVIGLNEKAVKELRTFAHEPSQSSNMIALDLSAEPDQTWISLFGYKWSQRLYQECVQEGAIKSVKPWNGDPMTRQQYEDERSHSMALAQRVWQPRFAATPGFRDATVYWIVQCVGQYGGMAAYAKRVIEITEETNQAYLTDPKVIERDEQERKKAQAADARRVEVETYLAQVQDVITASTPRDAARAKAKK